MLKQLKIFPMHIFSLVGFDWYYFTNMQNIDKVFEGAIGEQSACVKYRQSNI